MTPARFVVWALAELGLGTVAVLCTLGSMGPQDLWRMLGLPTRAIALYSLALLGVIAWMRATSGTSAEPPPFGALASMSALGGVAGAMYGALLIKVGIDNTEFTNLAVLAPGLMDGGLTLGLGMLGAALALTSRAPRLRRAA